MSIHREKRESTEKKKWMTKHGMKFKKPCRQSGGIEEQESIENAFWGEKKKGARSPI